MKVRGNVVNSIDSFVKNNFPDGYEHWKSKLPKETRDLMANVVGKKWYPVQEGVLTPTRHLVDNFYEGNVQKGAWESGEHSAEVALKGIYKVFVVISTPSYLMKRASRILPTFYDPSLLEITQSGDKYMSIDIMQLPVNEEIIEYRIGGWMQRALEICGCKNVKVMVPIQLSNNDSVTRFDIAWE